MKIGLLSDTHGFLDPKIFHYFQCCDEIWHAGDIGEVAIITKLMEFKPFRGVYGNIDGREIRDLCPEVQDFFCEGLRVNMVHIAGKLPYYTKQLKQRFCEEGVPDLLVCGHSHILQVMRDKVHANLLMINPGAAGKYGFHHIRTLLRFELKAGAIQQMEVVELGPRSTPIPNATV
jgi:putative phosphoesterase